MQPGDVLLGEVAEHAAHLETIRGRPSGRPEAGATCHGPWQRGVPARTGTQAERRAQHVRIERHSSGVALGEQGTSSKQERGRWAEHRQPEEFHVQGIDVMAPRVDDGVGPGGDGDFRGCAGRFHRPTMEECSCPNPCPEPCWKRDTRVEERFSRSLERTSRVDWRSHPLGRVALLGQDGRLGQCRPVQVRRLDRASSRSCCERRHAAYPAVQRR
jgi:hypothetical protein